MKRKLLKTFLLAAGLLVGTSAWAETTTVGTDNTTGWWSAFSDYYTIEPHSTLKVTFKNYTDKSDNCMNYIGVITTDADRATEGYSEYAVMRADCYGWQGSKNTNDDNTWFTSNTNNFNWDTFKDDMDGATVVMTVRREAAKVSLVFDVTTTASKSYQHTFIMNCGDGTQNIRAFLTTEKGHLTDIYSINYANEGINYNSSYLLPDGYAIKNTYIGTSNGTSVAPETFENVASVPTGWDKGTTSTLEMGSIDKIGVPAIGSAVIQVPTYVGGKAIKTAYRGRNYDLHSVYTLSSPVTKGDFVFNGDLYQDSWTYHYSYLSVVDSEGNNLLKVGFSTASGVRPIMCTYMNAEGVQTNLGNNTGLTTIRTYHAYGIKDLVIKPETGAFSFTVDYVDRNSKRAQTTFNGTLKAGVTIAAIYVGTVYTDTKNTITNSVYLDNVSLFNAAQQYDYTINYKVGETIVKTVNGKAFEGDVINAEESVTVSEITYTPTGSATTSMTIGTSTNVLDVAVAASVPYTITYKYGEETIKSENGYAITGETVDATYTTSLWNDANDTKYFVADGETTTFDIAASDNNFTVALRLAATDAVATINAKAGGTTHKTFTSAAGIEGEAVTVYYTHGIQSDVDSKFYTVTADNYSKALTYGETTNVDYTLDETIVYYSEFDGANYSEAREGVSGGTVKAYNGTTGQTTTLDAGLYTVYVKVTEGRNRSSSSYRGLSISVGGKTYYDSKGTSAALHEFAIAVPVDDCAFRLYKGYNETDWMDYMIIRRTGDLPATENIVVSDAGFATYVSNYNLDFTSATTKAYKVNVAEQGVATLTQVDEVPAKTPVLLYAAGGNGAGEAITVSSDAMDAVTGNDLVAGTGANVATDGGDYTNMILNNVDSKIGFYFANGKTVAANRAYLHIATSMAPDKVTNSRMMFVFDGEATGIQSIENGKLSNDNYYDLQGRRVAQPTKGLYIKNGKKVIMK